MMLVRGEKNQAPWRVALPVFLLAFTHSAGLAQADEAPIAERRESLALQYQVAPGCPEAEFFVQELGGLTQAARIVSSESKTADRRLTIVARVEAAGFSGSMHLADSQGESKRTIKGDTCDEVMSALALAVALAVDPNALGGSEPQQAEPAEQSPSLPQEEEPRPIEPEREPTAKSRSKSHVSAPTEHALRLWLSGIYTHGFWLVEQADVQGELETQLETRRQLAGGVELQLPRFLWSASLGAELGGAWGKVEDLSFSWTPSVRVFACPYWFEGHSWFRLTACLGGDFSVQRNAASSDLEQAQSASRSYAGIDTRLRFAFVRGAIRLELQAGVEMPLVQTKYFGLNNSGEPRLLFQTGSLPSPTVGVALGWNIF